MLILLLYQIWVHKDVCGTGTRDEPLRTYVWEAKFMTELNFEGLNGVVAFTVNG